MNTVPDLYTPSRSFSTVRQNSSDLFMNLPQAIERHIDNKDAGVILSFSLAYENATSNFKTKKKTFILQLLLFYHTIDDTIKACENVNTETHKAQSDSCSSLAAHYVFQMWKKRPPPKAM